MKLIKVQVTNYRNIIDSNEVEIGATSCLVGKNEAGKTAFLKALEGLRSTNPKFKDYGKIENYPRRFLAEYPDRHPDGEAIVVRTTWEMSDEDIAAVEAELGEGVLTGKTVEISKAYEQQVGAWSVPVDDEKVLAHLVKQHGLTKEEKSAFADVETPANVAKVLEALETKTDSQKELLAAIKKFRDNSSDLRVIDVLNPRTPNFLYFSHYDRMSGEIAIDQLNADKTTPEGIKTGDQVFLDFLEYAGTGLDELIGSTRFEEMNAKCEAAANRITDQIFEYWTQNGHNGKKCVLN